MVRSGDLSVTAPLSKPSFAKTALNPLFGIALGLEPVNVLFRSVRVQSSYVPAVPRVQGLRGKDYGGHAMTPWSIAVAPTPSTICATSSINES
jgi:hypothetical protein